MTTLLKKISDAFSKRKLPKIICDPDQLSPDEYKEVLSFSVAHWSDLNSDIVEYNYEAIFWLTPEAFCYYLPGILSTGIKEGIPGLLINHALINMLDRSPEPDYWDDFFLDRWLQLSQLECEMVSEWILWLSSCEQTDFGDSSLSRAFDTMELLKMKVVILAV